MSENVEIKISGIDFGMVGYYRLDDVKKGVFSTENNGKKITQRAVLDSDKFPYRYRFKDKNVSDVVFNTENLIRVKKEEEEYSLSNYIKSCEVGISNPKYKPEVFITKECLKNIQTKFKNADVLFFSGHHYGDNYDHYYCEPGFMHGGSVSEIYPSFWLQGLFTSCGDSCDKPMVYEKVKLVIAVGCKYIRRNMFCLYKRLFPNAVVVGYHCSAPLDDADQSMIIQFFEKMKWRLLFDENQYKKEIVRKWKSVVEKNETLVNCKPGYYYSVDESKVQNNINEYYEALGKIVYGDQSNHPDWEAHLPQMYEFDKESYEIKNGVIVLGYNYLLDDAYVSKYYCTYENEEKKIENEKEEYFECEQFEGQINHDEWKIYEREDLLEGKVVVHGGFVNGVKNNFKNKKKYLKDSKSSWFSILPEGKIYRADRYGNGYIKIVEDVYKNLKSSES